MSNTKTRPGCVNCRQRHLKCDDEQVDCSRCRTKGLECVRIYNVRFRHGANPSVANVKGSGLRKCEYDFAEDQIWCKTSHHLQFIDESSEVVAEYEDAEEPDDSILDAGLIQPHSPQFSPGQQSKDHGVSDNTQGDLFIAPPRLDVAFSPPVLRRRTDSHGRASDRSPGNTFQSGILPATSPGFAYVPTPNSLSNIIYNSPAAQSSGTAEVLHPLTASISHHSLDPGPSPLTSSLARIYLEGSPWPLQQRQEAVLMRHFVENLSVSLDICDPERHFALVVPRRAAVCPTLLNAIFACSARHLSRISDLDPYVSEKYHQECLKHLIPMLDDGDAMMDENLLAATIILRFFEEVKDSRTSDDDDDSESHLLGSHIFITAQESSTIIGGLRQAAFWVGLRQEIFFAYIKQRSILPALTHSNIDRSFEPADDHIWANRIIVHCADVIRYCYGGGGAQSTAVYGQLVDYCDAWIAMKPSSFDPMFYQDPGESSFYPEIWLLGDAVVTGLQHYYLARILLTAHNPHLPRLGPASKAALANMEEEIKSYVRLICAMAWSNPRAPPNFASAMMAVACVGDRFVNVDEQQALLELLEKAAEIHTGLAEKVKSQLKAAWAENTQ